MSRQRFILMIVATAVLALFAGDALGGLIAIGSYHNCGYFIGGHIGCPTCVAPVPAPLLVGGPHHGGVVVGPHSSRFIPLWRPHGQVVVVEQPRVRRIVVDPAPAVRVVSHPVVAKQATVTVWITNSNGSRTSVSLTRSGPGYLGPRGEWYPNMPTDGQLRVVYGF